MLRVIILCCAIVLSLSVVSALTPDNNHPSISKHNFQLHYHRGPAIVSTDYGSRVNAILKYNNLNDTTVAVPMPQAGSKALQFWAKNLCFDYHNFALRCDVVNSANQQIVATKLIQGGGAPCDRVEPANYFRAEFILNAQVTATLGQQNSLQCSLFNSLAVRPADINNQRQHAITAIKAAITKDTDSSEADLDEAMIPSISPSSLFKHHRKQHSSGVSVSVNVE
jgi:hypothetical protein